jgi:hypothetical protein
MTNRFATILCILCFTNLSYAQEWMTNIEIAQKLALVQNKMVLMVWEETTKYDYPVLVNDHEGRTIYIQNLFEDENISPLIWKHFIPVIVSEHKYADLYDAAKGKRKKRYIDKLNDDGIKIMDVNGYIVNVNTPSLEYINITTLINRYALNTDYVSAELRNYLYDKDVYSAYFLASKYLDLALYSNEKIRSEIVDLSNIYLDEALVFAEKRTEKDKSILEQRCALLKIQEFLILKRPKKVIRQLKKIDAETMDNANQSFVAFLYYTAYMSMEDAQKAEAWKSKISLVNLKKAQMLINLNT